MVLATVVLPVPGLPVKLMCNVGFVVARPRRSLTRLTSNNDAISAIRAFTGASPMRLVSSSAR